MLISLIRTVSVPLATKTVGSYHKDSLRSEEGKVTEMVKSENLASSKS